MQHNKLRWGIMGLARIARNKIIPAVSKCEFATIQVVASRNLEKARHMAIEFGIPTACSYDLLLADDKIDAVYIPLPNHLHIPWAIKSLQSGKDVLLEKPAGLNTAEVAELITVTQANPKLKFAEAFMYKFHPQWKRCLEIIRGGQIGELQSVHTQFSFFNDDPSNIRNQVKTGGGALLDIGCYGVSVARYCFEDEPGHMHCTMQWDERNGTDTACSALMKFNRGFASLDCSIRGRYHQQVEIKGSHGRLILPWPFNPTSESPACIIMETENGSENIAFEDVDQYQLQFDAVSQAILNERPLPTALDDSLHQMRILDALRISAQSRTGLPVCL